MNFTLSWRTSCIAQTPQNDSKFRHVGTSFWFGRKYGSIAMYHLTWLSLFRAMWSISEKQPDHFFFLYWPVDMTKFAITKFPFPAFGYHGYISRVNPFVSPYYRSDPPTWISYYRCLMNCILHSGWQTQVSAVKEAIQMPSQVPIPTRIPYLWL